MSHSNAGLLISVNWRWTAKRKKKLPFRGFQLHFFGKTSVLIWKLENNVPYPTHYNMGYISLYQEEKNLTVHIVCDICTSLCCCGSWEGHNSCSALTVMRWPVCDCRDNSYQQLLAAVLSERGFVCFGFAGVRKLLSAGLFPSANSPAWLIKNTTRQERETVAGCHVSPVPSWRTADAAVVVGMLTCRACVRLQIVDRDSALGTLFSCCFVCSYCVWELFWWSVGGSCKKDSRYVRAKG